MTCLEAQSNFMAFIDRKLPDDKAADFVRHMHFCPNCAEELEIYYTLIVGIRQVDNNEETSKDFKKDLEYDLNRIENKIKNAKRFKISTFGVFFILLVFMVFFVYNSILIKVNIIEQNIIKNNQGHYYFYNHFYDDISMCQEDIIVDAYETYTNLELEEEPTFYELVREYEALHPDINSQDEEENDENKINEIHTQ